VTSFLAFATGAPDQEISVTECLPAGTWYLFGAPSGFSGVPCGSEYVVTLSCAPCKAVGVCEDPNAGDCCVANGGVGCNDPECCTAVCAVDPFCCDVEWDGICADEANQMCEVCGTPGSNCCVAHPTPGCDDPDCEAAVCAVDPFCCDVEWDGICAGEAEDICGKLCGTPQGCVPGAQGDCCQEGGLGTPGCGDAACCAAICAIDPFCCDVAWDGICADEAQAEPICDCVQEPGPPNDNCPNRLPIENGSTDFDNINATTDGPAPCGGLGSDIWYNYNSDFTGDLIIDTFGSGFDTVLSMYNGCTCPPGTNLACNDDSGGTLQSEIIVPVVAGQCYKLQVGGFVGSQGSGVINITKDVATGACCFAGGECLQVSAVECENLGGNFLGEGTNCSAGYDTTSCNNPFSSIVGLPGTVMAPIASSSDDAGDAGIPIGFSFDFFGDSHTTIGIASNGYLSFGAVLGDFTNDPIPNTLTPNDMIAPYWDDWAPNQGGDVFYRSAGGTFTVQWNNVLHFGGTGPATFQAILHQGTNCVEYRYGTPLSPNSPTIGVENQDGTVGFPGGFGPPVSSGSCVLICPAGNPCPTEIDVNVDIKPGECPNPFHLTTNGQATLTVVIVGKADFDVSTVDVSSLSIGGVSPLASNGGDVSTAGGSGNCECGANGGDGIPDLVLHFQRTALQAALGLDSGDVGDTVELTITGALDDGTPLTGSDCVVVD
jgi:hypothetical protein